ncbi:MAG: response regulator [Acidobacteria bacterium]|nr:response regulator [Acidobacteriota bacterium]
MPRIAVVEDEPDIADILRFHLERGGFEVEVHGRGDLALAAIQRRPPDLVLLDLMLPGLDGLEVCRFLKRKPETAGVPIVMLTARAEETDRIVGLELGADDYIPKPFNPREVVLRVRAVLRRQDGAAPSPSTVLAAGTIRLHVDAHRLEVAGEDVAVTATEFRLLQHLMGRADRVQTRDALLSEVWGYAEGVDSRTVDTHVRRLRHKLGPEWGRIETIIGVGYRFRS